MKVTVTDNYLTQSYHKEIHDLFMSTEFPWYYNSNITKSKEDTNTKSFNEYGFTHWFYIDNCFRNSQYATFIKPMLLNLKDTVNCECILRSRADMVMWSLEDFIHPSHVDFDYSNVATILYINDTDGDTILYDQNNPSEIKERVNPKANRLVIFDGDVLHTGCSPTKHKNRILINSNFK